MTNDGINAVMHVPLTGFLLCNQLVGRRNGHIDPYPKGIPRFHMFMGFLDTYTTAGKMVAYVLQFFSFRSDEFFKVCAFLNIFYRNLKWYIHVATSYLKDKK